MGRNSNDFSIGDLLNGIDLRSLEQTFGEIPLDSLTVEEGSRLIRRKQSVIRAWIQQGKLRNVGTPGEMLVERKDLLAVDRNERLREELAAKKPNKPGLKERQQPNRPPSTTKRKQSTTKKTKRKEEFLPVRQAARLLNVNVEILNMCIRRNLIPAFNGPSREQTVRLSDITTREFASKLIDVQRAMAARKPSSTGVRNTSGTNGTPQRIHRTADPEKVVVPAMLKRLREIEAMAIGQSATAGERAYLRSEIRRRDPEAYNEYLKSLEGSVQ